MALARVLVAFVLLVSGCETSGGGDAKAPAASPTTTPVTGPVTAGAAPGAPSTVATSVLSATSVRVAWRDNASNEDGFRVERAQGTGAFQSVGTVAAGTQTYDDLGLAPSTSYVYRVVAFNAAGATLSTNQAPATTSAAPPVRVRKPIGANPGVGYYDANGFMGYLAGKGYHLGEDWNGNGGGDTDLRDPVYAVADGIVRAARDAGKGWGNIVAIEHDLNGEKYVSFYAHLYAIDPALPAIGAAIKRGTVVGGIGKGYKNAEYAAHLHFEFRKGTSTQPGPGYTSSVVQTGPQGQVEPTPFY